MPQANAYCIVGLGLTGLSCARFLTAQGIPHFVIDSRAAPPMADKLTELCPDTSLHCGDFAPQLLEQTSRIIASPGLATDTPFFDAARQRGIAIDSDIDLFCEHSAAPIIAITGTNGKSTVAKLVYEMALASGEHAAIGGNYGIPALDCLAPEITCYVLELSSFQLELTHNLRDHFACLLNCAPDHLDRYADFAAYVAAKQRIFMRSRAQVYCLDDPTTEPTELAAKPRVFALTNSGDHQLQPFQIRDTGSGLAIYHNDRCIITAEEFPLHGQHNLLNACAALTLGQLAGFGLAAMIAALKQFEGLSYRCQLVKEHQQVRWFNDSKGTNVAATAAAIAGLVNETPGQLILILGGVTKGDDFTSLLPMLTERIRAVLIFGEGKQTILDALGEHLPCTACEDLPAVVKQAEQLAKSGDSVLFSPACASFDMFENYLERGKQFNQLLETVVCATNA